MMLQNQMTKNLRILWLCLQNLRMVCLRLHPCKTRKMTQMNIPLQLLPTRWSMDLLGQMMMDLRRPMLGLLIHQRHLLIRLTLILMMK
jgi:hypothetical protein